MARLVDNLLNMTRLESGIQARKASQPLEDVVGAALARLERRLHGRSLTTSLPHDLPLVLIDDVLIEQVLINLLDNAIKYTGSESPLELSAFVSDGMVTVQLADRGPGLDPGDEERVFEKFHRGASGPRRAPGWGSRSAGHHRRSGGRIWAENRPDGGAVFRFTCPWNRCRPISRPHMGEAMRPGCGRPHRPEQRARQRADGGRDRGRATDAAFPAGRAREPGVSLP